jgi:hypothetical protein
MGFGNSIRQDARFRLELGLEFDCFVKRLLIERIFAMSEHPKMTPLPGAQELPGPVSASKGLSLSRGKTWLDAQGLPEVAAKLTALPNDLQFPDDFPEPICFDTARKLLLYRGFMSYSSYRCLRQLHADTEYTRALEELFIASSGVQQPASQGSGWWIIVLCLAVASAALAVAIKAFR